MENQITGDNVGKISPRVRIIAEGANGPTTPEADTQIKERGILLIPDFQARPGCILFRRLAMKFQELTFGQIRIDDTEYGYDIVIDRGKIRKRKRKPSKTRSGIVSVTRRSRWKR